MHAFRRARNSATTNVHLHGHLNLDSARRHLKRIRAKDTENGILVVTESLFSMDSDTPDLRALQELCREYEATLFVDVAHDLGAMGGRRSRVHRHARHGRQNRHRDGELFEDICVPTAASSPATRRRSNST